MEEPMAETPRAYTCSISVTHLAADLAEFAYSLAQANPERAKRIQSKARLLKTKTVYEGLIRVEADAVVSALSSALAVSGAGDYGESGPETYNYRRVAKRALKNAERVVAETWPEVATR
jgi:hypothetical protein